MLKAKGAISIRKTVKNVLLRPIMTARVLSSQREASAFLIFSQNNYLFFGQTAGPSKNKNRNPLYLLKKKNLSKGRLSKGIAFVLGTGRSAHVR